MTDIIKTLEELVEAGEYHLDQTNCFYMDYSHLETIKQALERIKQLEERLEITHAHDLNFRVYKEYGG